MLAFLQTDIGRLCFVICNAFASLSPSPQKGLKNSCACLWRTDTGTGFFILPGNHTHFFEPPPAFPTVTIVNEVVTQIQPQP